MNTNKGNPAEKKSGQALLLGSLLLYIVTLVMYLTQGTNEFTTTLSVKVIAGLGAAAALGVLMLLRPIKMVKYAVYICGLYAWLQFLSSQVYYIVNVFVAIDGTSFSAPFLITTLAGTAAWVLALVSAAKQKSDVGAALWQRTEKG